MNNYVLILVKTPYEKTPYDLWLNNTGIKPIIFTSPQYAKEYSHFEDFYVFEDYDTSDRIEKKALELNGNHNIIAVFARAESDIIRASQIRTKLNVQGQSPESAYAFRDKSIMKSIMQKNDIPIARYKEVKSTEEIIDFVDKVGFPFVVKPPMESGSTGVAVIKNKEELNKLTEKIDLTNKYLVEEFIKGEMYHIDGLVVNDEIVFIHPFKYINDCLEYRNDNYLAGVPISQQDPLFLKLVENTKEVLNALPCPKNTAFHTEIWLGDNNNLIFCEIASRSGGATIGLAIEHGFGFNIDRKWFEAECGIFEHFDIQYTPCGWMSIPPFKGKLLELPNENKNSAIVKSQYSGKIGEIFNGGVKSGLFLAGFAISGETENKVEENIISTSKWFYNNSKWEIID